MHRVRHRVRIQGYDLEYQRLSSAHPNALVSPMVFLHEGLGSIAMWRDFPQRVADTTGCEAIVYSRAGYGQSSPMITPRSIDYMHHEAQQVLPEFLATLNIERPYLLGHSDGASIALIYAGGVSQNLSGLIVMAPHVMVEDICIQSITKAKHAYEVTDLPTRLGRYHQDFEGAFRGWNNIWLHPDFRDWNIEAYLPLITCPVLAMQGEDDEYGTMMQIEKIERAIPQADTMKLADCRHALYKDQPETIIAAINQFVARQC